MWLADACNHCTSWYCKLLGGSVKSPAVCSPQPLVAVGYSRRRNAQAACSMSSKEAVNTLCCLEIKRKNVTHAHPFPPLCDALTGKSDAEVICRVLCALQIVRYLSYVRRKIWKRTNAQLPVRRRQVRIGMGKKPLIMGGWECVK